MRKSHFALIIAAALFTQPVFADQDMTAGDSKPCAKIVKACLDAGYNRDQTQGKLFWQDCMKPIILGQTVQGTTVDNDTVKMCRADKIAKLKKELAEFQKAFSTTNQ